MTKGIQESRTYYVQIEGIKLEVQNTNKGLFLKTLLIKAQSSPFDFKNWICLRKENIIIS